MKSNRGVALILALLVLSFLTILGGALLATSIIDVWISDNYKSATQNLYLTEAGIDQARELLRTTPASPAQLLASAAGSDGRLSTSTDLAALLAGDDQPLIPSDAALRAAGQPLIDSGGRIAGRYYVWLRNDNEDGPASTFDSNDTLTLLSVGQIGTTRKTIETTVRRGGFPGLPNPVTVIDAASSGVEMDPRMKTVHGLESFVRSITRNAADIYTPADPAGQPIGNYGAASNYGVAVINGNVRLGPGTGYGLLLVRGELDIADSFTWNGLILVIGKGAVHWNRTIPGSVHGGLFIARTRADDGMLLSVPGAATADFDAGNVHSDAAAVQASNHTFPYDPIAIRER